MRSGHWQCHTHGDVNVAQILVFRWVPYNKLAPGLKKARLVSGSIWNWAPFTHEWNTWGMNLMRIISTPTVQALVWHYFDWIQNSMKLCNAVVDNIFGRSQWNFAHVTTVLLSWCVQNFIVIGGRHVKPEHSKFWWNLEFDRNTISGIIAR